MPSPPPAEAHQSLLIPPTPTRRTNTPFPPGFTFGGLALASHGVLIP
ncbi:hypothetical protein [Corynebacterium matruchotii]|nr:hypothetical protein [Corynebacterium matruchotii]